MFVIKNILRNINSIPFPLTIKHYFVFDDATAQLKDNKLHSAESWDTLRQSHPHFSISENRDEWLAVTEQLIKKDGQDGGLIKRARDVADVIEKLGIESVFSVGVGGAGLEYHIKKIKPDIRLTCSEYSKVAVERLKKVFTEADSVILFDMKKDDWSVALKGNDPKKQLCLMYRIDIDVSNDEFKNMFQNMHNAGVENILIILCGRLTLRGLFNRLSQRLRWRLRGVTYAFAGYLRSQKTFPDFWRGLYASTELECGGLKSFLLK